MSRVKTSMGPTLDDSGRISGEMYGELQDRAEEQRQLEAAYKDKVARDTVMARRIKALELQPEEWLWEVVKRDEANKRWEEKWHDQQKAINNLAIERHDIKVAILELRHDLGRLASEEERNGNFKTADVLRMVTLRLKSVVQDKIEQDRKGQDNGEHR